MEEKPFKNTQELLIDIAKIATSFSIGYTILGFFYIAVYIKILIGDTTFYPLSIQDIFIVSRRWSILIALYALTMWQKDTGTFKKYLYKYNCGKQSILLGFIAFISRTISYYSLLIASILYCCIISYENILNFNIFKYIIYITIIAIFVHTALSTFFPKFKIIMSVCALTILSVYNDIAIMYNDTTHYIISTRSGVYSGKICLYVSDGIFLQTKHSLIYLKNNSVQKISKKDSISYI